MDTSRNDLLGELAADAALERTDFLASASAQLGRFLDGNEARIRELGGVVLIDDEVDYLAIAEDMTFRSRSRYQDETTGKWVTDTEVIESAAELVELYNLADVFAAFAEATKLEAGMEPEPTAAGELLRSADIAPEETIPLGAENPYAAAADDWAAAHEFEEAPETEEEAAERLYDLALAFQERSQQTEAHLLEQFESAASQLTAVLGDLIVVDDEDERLTLRASGAFAAEVVSEEDVDSGQWKKLDSPDEIVKFYDPTDVFGDLADALAEAFPELAEEPRSDEPEEPEEEGEAEEAEDKGEGKEGGEDVEGKGDAKEDGDRR
ncbi:MAG: hypothetical protein ABSD62_11620 [Candidatus Limnocylindrales bacterium]|jgi:hypothetical protein